MTRSTGTARNESAAVPPPFPVPRLPFPLNSPWPQRIVQFLLLAGYVALFALGLGYDAIPGIPDLHPRIYTHATTLLFWVVWFMGLILLVPFVGRGWCGVCPLGAACDWVGRRGLGLPWPRWISRGAGAIVVFAAGVAVVVWADAHQSPHRTALVIGIVALAALLSALVWRRSAFCRGLCPVGGVLDLYGRHAPVEIRPREPGRCASCATRGCVARKPQWRRWDLGNLVFHRRRFGGGCPVALYPPDMDPGACLLCLRCIRNCPDGNLGLFWGARGPRRPLAPWRAVLLLPLTGLVTLALLRTWPDARLALTPGVLPPVWWSSLWLGLGVPLVLLGAPGVVARWSRGIGGRAAERPGIGNRPASIPRVARKGWTPWLTVAAAFVGPVFGGHLALAAIKLNAKIGYLPYLAYDPLGAETYVAIHVGKILPLPDLVIPMAGLRWVAVALFALGCLFGFRELVRRWKDPVTRRLAVFATPSWLALVGLLGAALTHWMFAAR